MRPNVNHAANNQNPRGNEQPGSPARDGQRRRRNSESPSRTDDDEPPNKRIRPIVLSSKRRPTDPFGVAARRITRTVDLCWNPTLVIDAGVSLLALDCDEAIELEQTTASPKKQALYDMFSLLCELIPGLQETRTLDWDVARAKLDRHKSAAKTEDNHALKESSVKWLEWNPPLNPKSKAGRGLAHPQCAELLCPIEVNREDKTAFEKFRVDNIPAMTAGRWPAFLYDGYKADLDDLAKGFMRSDIMLQAGRDIIFPPSIARAKEEPDHQSNRKTKAEIYQLAMDGVTPGFLGYVAVQVRYAISAETSFNHRGGTFNYTRFYKSLVAHLEDPVCKSDTDELLEWWNSKLFPLKPVAEDDEEADLVAQMREQRQAKNRR